VSGATNHKVVILDRDGTIVIDRNYLSDAAGLEFLPGAAEGLRAMHEQGYRLIVITNQSGVGRGLFSLQSLEQMNLRLQEMFQSNGARLERVYFCPHRPDEHCQCRKPNTQLLKDAAAELGFEPSRAIVIGDKDSDVEFGKRAGAVTMLVATGDGGRASASIAPDYIVRDLQQAAAVLRSRDRGAI
jgi:D-glycero-D-manno-heptose 1,7-bisphosphate phosphatase